jgi:hypothetical protein
MASMWSARWRTSPLRASHNHDFQAVVGVKMHVGGGQHVAVRVVLQFPFGKKADWLFQQKPSSTSPCLVPYNEMFVLPSSSIE